VLKGAALAVFGEGGGGGQAAPRGRSWGAGRRTAGRLVIGAGASCGWRSRVESLARGVVAGVTRKQGRSVEDAQAKPPGVRGELLNDAVACPEREAARPAPRRGCRLPASGSGASTMGAHPATRGRSHPISERDSCYASRTAGGPGFLRRAGLDTRSGPCTQGGPRDGARAGRRAERHRGCGSRGVPRRRGEPQGPAFVADGEASGPPKRRTERGSESLGIAIRLSPRSARILSGSQASAIERLWMSRAQRMRTVVGARDATSGMGRSSYICDAALAALASNRARRTRDCAAGCAPSMLTRSASGTPGARFHPSRTAPSGTVPVTFARRTGGARRSELAPVV
jgi:hypothetical protein